MRYFYVNQSPVNDQIILDKNDSRHLVQVLRSQVGDQVTVVDGKGNRFIAALTDPNPKRAGLAVKSSSKDQILQPELHLAVAPTKTNDRFEIMVEKATELGVHQITPIICDHSERKKYNTERAERIAIAAIKQSRKAYLPVINEAVPFQIFIEKHGGPSTYVAHCYDNDSAKNHLFEVIQSTRLSDAITICIGPEGDFSTREVTLTKELGCIPVSLGNQRLRTETAAIAACHCISLYRET